MKKEIEIIEYDPTKKKADPNSADLVLGAEAPVPSKLKKREEFSWHPAGDCVVVQHQPAIAVHLGADGSVCIYQDGFLADRDDVVYFHARYAEAISEAILTLAKRVR